MERQKPANCVQTKARPATSAPKTGYTFRSLKLSGGQFSGHIGQNKSRTMQPYYCRKKFGTAQL
jgi:hypothetical protein